MLRAAAAAVLLAVPALGAPTVLTVCPKAPHCVSSMDKDPRHAVAALAFTGDPAAAWSRLKEALASLPRTSVVEETPGYIHAVCVSMLLRFKDDLEFLLVPESSRIELRSSSRVGYADMGVNRRRVERLRKEFRRRLSAHP